MVDSDAKLRAMHLPDMTGGSFFDVACNEGFYCGAALSLGAARVVGLDGHAGFVAAAQARFPKVEFLCQSWDTFPDEKFDYVLYASAMHYLRSETEIASMLERLRDCLQQNGILILEVGVAAGEDMSLKEVQRGDGSKVFYPTERLLISLIRNAGLIERYKGQSEPGDGIARHVYHCNIRKPTLLILDGKPNTGKTRFGWAIAAHDYGRIISVDQLALKTFASHFPNVGYDEREFSAVDHFFIQSSKTAASTLAEALRAEITEMSLQQVTKGWQQATIIIDGLDLQRDDHRSIRDTLMSQLGDNFVVWTAIRSQ